MMATSVTVVGNPGSIGGAPVETWATMRLWTDHGVAVTCLPTSPLQERWQGQIGAYGIKVLPVAASSQAIAKGVTTPIAVAFCSAPFVTASPDIQAKLIWLGCQTYAFPAEAKVPVFDAYVFQSQFQMDAMSTIHAGRSVPDSRRYLIRGVFDVDEFWAKPRHRAAHEPFVIGRISRPHPWKYTADIWKRFATIRKLVPHPLQFRIMGWTYHGTRPKTGNPPDWVECLPPGAVSTQAFLNKCHALCQFGDAHENWPRVGLEAMAAGVPLVVDDNGGWREMIEHNKTGFLAGDGHMAACITIMANDDTRRLAIACAAQDRVRKLSDPDAIWAKWEKLFGEIM